MCTVLLAYASRMGATREIAEVLTDELRQTDHTVTIASCATAPEADQFDAVVIGSALYAGRWMPEASSYLHRQATHLTNRPTFLFQSGPCDTDRHSATSTAVPHTVTKTIRRFGLPEPITFAGRIDPTKATGRMSRWMANALPAGDFRDWTAIRGATRSASSCTSTSTGARSDPTTTTSPWASTHADREKTTMDSSMLHPKRSHPVHRPVAGPRRWRSPSWIGDRS